MSGCDGQPLGGPTIGTRLLAAALALPALGVAQADEPPERAQLSFKLLDYRDRQPGEPRIRVRAPALGLTAPLAGPWSFSGTLVHDTISGASPAYHTSALTPMRDERRAAEVGLTRYFERSTISFGASASHESDYTSRGLSLLGTHAGDDRNTTWNAGLAVGRDRIEPNNHIVDRERKRVTDLIVGVTQVLGTHDLVQLNLSHRRGSGYFSDPYKIFDNRPRRRDHDVLLLRWNHHLEVSGGTLRSSWRYYHDSWGIKAHTLGFEYVQPLPQGWTLAPLVRLHTQTAARFYVDADPSTEPFPPNPPADAVYFSEDQRLASFGGRTFGLKVGKRIGADWAIDLKYERYTQRSAWAWRSPGSPWLAPLYARSVQLGVSYAF